MWLLLLCPVPVLCACSDTSGFSSCQIYVVHTKYMVWAPSQHSRASGNRPSRCNNIATPMHRANITFTFQIRQYLLLRRTDQSITFISSCNHIATPMPRPNLTFISSGLTRNRIGNNRNRCEACVISQGSSWTHNRRTGRWRNWT